MHSDLRGKGTIRVSLPATDTIFDIIKTIIDRFETHLPLHYDVQCGCHFIERLGVFMAEIITRVLPF